MITLHGFGTIFPEGRGETKDLRVQWALEELGLPYRFHGLDHTGGELEKPEYRKLSPFRQAPVIEDDGFVVAESAAEVLYLAEKAGKLIPGDPKGRIHVTQWCFAAVATVAPTLQCLDVLAIFDEKHVAGDIEAKVKELAHRWLEGVAYQLEDRDWLVGDDFTVADLMMACVLREIRKTDLMKPFPKIESYYKRCFDRPAWQRTLASTAERLGMKVDEIR